jgi:hypothetical protein
VTILVKSCNHVAASLLQLIGSLVHSHLDLGVVVAKIYLNSLTDANES